MRWTEFLTDHFIDYVTSGPLTTRGHIEIKCPFCGDLDESMHLGIHLTSDRWYCWRDKSHRGNKPEYLISRLIGVSKAQAALLIEAYASTGVDDFDAVTALTAPLQGPVPVTWPSEFEPLTPRFMVYLESRGFDKPTKLAAYYNLECCRVGRWQQRLIIPILDHERNILGWQGRAIVTPKKAPRYLTSHQQVKKNIYNLQNLNQGGEVLFVCEGPFDSLKIDYYGKPRYRSTCLFGVNPTVEQIAQLSQLMPKFRKTVILFDNDSSGLSGGFNLCDWLPGIQCGQQLSTSDPGGMSKAEILRYLAET